MRAFTWFFKSKWYSLFPGVSDLSPLNIKILTFLHGLRKRNPLPTESDVRCEFLEAKDSFLENTMISLEYDEYIHAGIHRDPKFPRTVFTLTEKGRKELQRCGHL